jgi:hypothetical protein
LCVLLYKCSTTTRSSPTLAASRSVNTRTHQSTEMK